MVKIYDIGSLSFAKLAVSRHLRNLFPQNFHTKTRSIHRWSYIALFTLKNVIIASK
jgi:hypothetical protein